MNNADDLYAAIGSGNARLQQVVNFIEQTENKKKPQQEIDPQSLIKQNTNKQAVDKNGITVSGVGNLLTHMAKCCQPVPGDEILGFITQGRGISVHRADCEQLSNSLKAQPEREVEVQWGVNSKQNYQVSIQILANDRQGLLRDVSTIIANDRLSILGLSSHQDAQKQLTKMQVELEITDQEMLQRLLNKLLQLDDVIEAKRS